MKPDRDRQLREQPKLFNGSGSDDWRWPSNQSIDAGSLRESRTIDCLVTDD